MHYTAGLVSLVGASRRVAYKHARIILYRVSLGLAIMGLDSLDTRCSRTLPGVINHLLGAGARTRVYESYYSVSCIDSRM